MTYKSLVDDYALYGILLKDGSAVTGVTKPGLNPKESDITLDGVLQGRASIHSRAGTEEYFNGRIWDDFISARDKEQGVKIDHNKVDRFKEYPIHIGRVMANR